MGGGGGKGGGGSANPNLDQVINNVVNAASTMDLSSFGATNQNMTEGATGLGTAQQRMADYQKSLGRLDSLGNAPSGNIFSGKMDPLAAIQYGNAVQENQMGVARSNSELARQFGARGTDESAVLSTLQSEASNQAKLSRSPLLTAMMDMSRKIETEQRAADMQSYAANLQAAASGIAPTSQVLLAGAGRKVASSGEQVQNQTQSQESQQKMGTSTMQREQGADDAFMQGAVPGQSLMGPGTPRVDVAKPGTPASESRGGKGGGGGQSTTGPGQTFQQPAPPPEKKPAYTGFGFGAAQQPTPAVGPLNKK